MCRCRCHSSTQNDMITLMYYFVKEIFRQNNIYVRLAATLAVATATAFARNLCFICAHASHEPKQQPTKKNPEHFQFTVQNWCGVRRIGDSQHDTHPHTPEHYSKWLSSSCTHFQNSLYNYIACDVIIRINMRTNNE